MTLTSSAPACGFVRLPQDWLHLPISPQAKTLLMAFCGYADDRGESWFSYEQLGAILNRSRSSVCSYVRELRDHGLVSCTNQTYGNGYNYRLLIRVVGWAELLAHWASMTAKKTGRAKRKRRQAPAGTAATPEEAASPGQAATPGEVARPPRPPRSTRAATGRDAERGSGQDTKRDVQRGFEQDSERRVRDAERKDPSGPINQTHKTKTRRGPPRVVWSESDERIWHEFRPSDRDPPSASFGRPDRGVLEKAIAVAEDLERRLDYLDPDTSRNEARSALESFASRRDLRTEAGMMTEAAKLLAGKARTREAISAAMEALKAAWKPHWRRMSLPRQMMETVTPAIEATLPDRSLREAHVRFQGRALVARLHLRPKRAS